MPQIPFYAVEWREYRRLDIKEAAKRSRLKLSHITALESRDRHFDEHDICALANAYDINPTDLFNFDPSDPEDLKCWQEIEDFENGAS